MMNRKDFIHSSVLAAAGLSIGVNGYGNPLSSSPVIADDSKMKACIFSKQLQWLDYTDMAKAVADMGYDGIDLTVRVNGHVSPENVERDLPKAVAAAEKAGIKILMISTDIGSATEVHTEKILKTAASLHIHYYRMQGLNYSKAMDIPANLENIKGRYAGLVELNKKYGLHSCYLNHSGEGFGSAIWDLWLTIKDFDPKYIGSQYDIKHSTIDGPFSWPASFDLVHPYVQTMVIRDFRWEKNIDGWEVKPVPLGEGMVNLKKFFMQVKQYHIPGPACIMCDYDLGGAENGARSLTIRGNKVLECMQRDLETLKAISNQIGVRYGT